MRVLLVEDEVRLADNLAAALRDGPGLGGGIGPQTAKLVTTSRAVYAFSDLVILDLMLPKLGMDWHF